MDDEKNFKEAFLKLQIICDNLKQGEMHEYQKKVIAESKLRFISTELKDYLNQHDMRGSSKHYWEIGLSFLLIQNH